MDALFTPKAIFAGHDWGGRDACVTAALWPERCSGIVSVTINLIQDMVIAWRPLLPAIKAGFWHFYYFLTPRGVAGFALNLKGLARAFCTTKPPVMNFTTVEDLDRAVTAEDNPAYIDMVILCYRVRLLYAPGDPRYAELEEELLRQPPITVPTVTLDGLQDGNFPGPNWSNTAKYFTGKRLQYCIEGAAHNLPQEEPEAFADAAREMAELALGN